MPKLNGLLINSFCPAEKNGKTLHLLKSASKPTPAGKKRQKVPILGSFGEYSDSKKKAVDQNAKQNAQPPPASQAKPQGQHGGGSSIVQYMAPVPNAKDAKMSGK